MLTFIQAFHIVPSLGDLHIGAALFFHHFYEYPPLALAHNTCTCRHQIKPLFYIWMGMGYEYAKHIIKI